MEYDIDGVIYKIIIWIYRYSFDYKFKKEKAETIVKDIVIQVGRTGNITFVAELIPVRGVVLSRATLINKDEIEKKDILIDDHVIV